MCALFRVPTDTHGDTKTLVHEQELSRPGKKTHERGRFGRDVLKESVGVRVSE